MRSSAPARIGKLLGRSAASRLLAEARVLKELDGLLDRHIPPPLNDHSRVLSLRDATLVLAADSPVWAARLRFHTPQLVKQLRDNPAVKVRTVQVRVRPPQSLQVAETGLPKPRQLSASNADALQQTARSVSDPGLKAALMRLASRRRRRPGQE
jgi:hypothetical protein